MRRTKEQARETRAAILQSAEVLFLQKGFENVALDEVASAAGVTRGAVHWHFRNKQGLLFAIRDEMQQPMQELADRLLEDKALFPLDELADVISTSFRRLQADPRQRGLLRVLLQLDSREDADDQGGGDAFQRNLRSSLITVFEAVARNGKMPSFWTPASAAISFQAVINGLVTEWALGRTDFQLVPDGEATIRAILLSWTLLTRPAGANEG